MTRFQAVLFDFGGTLDADGEPAVAQFFRAYRLAGGGRSDAEFDALFRESDRRLANDPAILRLGFRETVELQSRLLAQPEGLDSAVIAKAVHDAAIAVAKRNVRLLAELREHGVRTAVISNFTGNLELCLEELALASMLDLVLDSAVVGARKPDRRIFEMALEQLGVAPECTLMVGDNPFADVQAAAEVGIATCWLAPLSRPVPDGCRPTFRITRLPELLAAMDAPSAARQAPPATCIR